MCNCRKIILSVFFIICYTINSYSQVEMVSLSGKVTDKKEVPLEGISVFLKGTNYGASTGINGKFVITNISPGSYTLVLSGMGLKKKVIEVSLTNNQEFLPDIKLDNDLTLIEEVVVATKTKTAKIKEQSFAVNSIETKKLKNTTIDVNQILNQTSGVRIKESGGLGSQYEFSLNGLSGRQIRIFVDDIPVDQLGNSFNLNNLTVNLVDRIDVYKGVVPIRLGADALGGAINIITNKKANSFLDLSYSIGSFNTHRSALNTKYRFKESGFTIKATGFHNYSDNNYTMNDLPVFVDGVEQRQDIERFHDTYESVMGNIGLGVTNVSWADTFIGEVSLANIEQDIQSGIFGTPVGEATEEEDNTTYSLKYSKSGLFNNKVDTDLFVLYNEVASKSIDTSSNRYDWSGRVIRTENNALGEIVREKTIFEFDQSQFLYRLHAKYNISKLHHLSINHIYSDIEREGENRLNSRDDEPFRSPNTLKKKVTGIAYESNFFKNKLENIVSVKYFDFDILTKNAIQFQQNQFEIQDIEVSEQKIGYALSSRFFITPNWYVKASYEKGYRIPQPIEIFGDGLRVIANPMLMPETSHNINLGMSYRTNISNASLKTDINLFQRDVDNFIFLQQTGRFSGYENVLSVLVKGIECDFSFTQKKYRITGNFTWQNVLNNQEFIAGTTTRSRVYRDKMPNTPYLFANTNINYNAGTIFSKINMSVYHSINYVHEFFLNYPSVSQTDTKNTIPDQFLNHIGATFSSTDNTYNLSIEARNIFDAEAFDNFNLQKPGRAIYLKLRYFINN